MSLVLTDDPTIQQLNATHLGQDTPTDVLSFGNEELDFPVPGRRYRDLGELVISLPTAERQAGEYGHPLRAELAHLVVHGLLHLQGHEHDSGESARAMQAAEADLVRAALGQLAERDRRDIVVPHAGDEGGDRLVY